jgi:hypothetical protein
MTTQVQFRVSGAVEDDLRTRANAHDLSPGQVVHSVWLVLQRMLRDQTPTFSAAEALLLMDILNGAHHDWTTANLVWASVEDAREDGIAERHPHVDIPALVGRLRKLTQLQAIALVRAVELAWDYASGPAGLPASDALRRAGLVG